MGIDKLSAVINLGAGWVLWLLFALSIISIGVMVERAVFYLGRRLPGLDALGAALLSGHTELASAAIAGRVGLEVAVVRAALDNANSGPDSIAKIVAAQIKMTRLDYEARLAFLATLGNNAPFVGLFGTVLGIIRAFGDLARNPSAGGASSVMAGISEALIATAVGLLVALPAVVAFNVFQRALRRASQRAAFLGDMMEAHLRNPAPGTEEG
jgi:biopolymer transport protein ExbB